MKRQLPVGAETGDQGVHFRVWAPDRQRVRVVLEGVEGDSPVIELQREADDSGYFSAATREASAGSLYRYLLDDDPMRYPDPASRFPELRFGRRAVQPDHPHRAA